MSILMPITLIFLLIIITVLFQVSKRVAHIKNMNTAFLIYIAILVVSTVIYFIIPKPEVQTEALQDEGQFDEQYEKVNADIESGRIDQLADYMLDEQSFVYSGKELILEVAPESEEWYMIYVEKTADHDGIVNVSQLHTGAYVNDIDVSGYLNPAKLEFNDDQLTLNDPKSVYVRKTAFNKEYPITQFSGDEVDPFGFSSSSSIGGSVIIYIQVPKDVLVKNDTGFDLQYVEK